MEQDRKETNGNMAAVILAGGYSSRMGAFKPLLKIGDLPAVDVLVQSFAAAGVGRIVVVTGHDHERLEEHIDHETRWRQNSNEAKLRQNNLEAMQQDAVMQVKIETVFNENHSEGMFTSVQKGISFLRSADEAAGGEIAGTFVIPVDCPAVSAETIGLMLDEIMNENTESFFSPAYMGKRGHPLFVPKRYWQEILDHDGRNGLRGITEKHPEKMINVPVEDEGILLDMDDAAGYERVKEFYENNLAGKSVDGPWEELGTGDVRAVTII